MNYELAKQLKDAGFKLKLILGDKDLKVEDVLYFDGETTLKGEKIAFVPPNLSELIEACGINFTGLYRQQPGFSGYWQAVCNMMPGIMMEGSTPEEAVAKLWLELNKK